MLKIILLLILGLLFSPHPVQADWTVDITPPTCSINPVSGSTITIGSSTDITVNGYDNVPGSIALALSLNSSPVMSRASSPLIYTWNPGSTGSYTFSAIATDQAGNSNTSAPCQATYSVNSVGSAWIKTSGDVHSNTRINAPGGPRD